MLSLLNMWLHRADEPNGGPPAPGKWYHDVPHAKAEWVHCQEDQATRVDHHAATSPGPASVPSTRALRLFVATWNMAAKDPFAHRKHGQYIGDALAAKALEALVPLGYDLYVIGTQEKVTKYLDAAVLARLRNGEKEGTNGSRYHRLGLRTAPPGPSRQTYQCQDATGGVPCRALVHGAKAGGTDVTWSLKSVEPNVPYERAPCSGDPPSANESDDLELRGHGDHALLRRKATSLAIYHAHHLDGRLQVVATGVHKFLGSKGGLAITLRLKDDPHTLTFANCHLDANCIERRLRQLDTLATELPRSLARGTTDVAPETLATCSDHVIWMGDFNYRLQHVSSTQVVQLLTAGRVQEVHAYDSMTRDLQHVPGLRSFREPVKWPTFYPTYKKVPYRSRLPLSGSITGTGKSTRWTQHVYKTQYREPLYKGGRVRERVPGWCDRILFCSREAGGYNGLEVEQVPWMDPSVPRDPVMRDNYRALNDELRGSDHSPVTCTFLWAIAH